MKLNFFLFIFMLIIMDQLVKAIVHFNMPLHSEISIVGDFIKLYHIENPGMAFGINFDFKFTKLFLSLFRLVASFLIGIYFIKLLKKKSDFILLLCVSLVFSGAVGNLIDSIFYGIFYGNAPIDAPFSLFNGQVIDMFYIDIWEGFINDNIPLIGGTYLSLWPVFNLADSYIFIGVAILLIFQKHVLLEN